MSDATLQLTKPYTKNDRVGDLQHNLDLLEAAHPDVGLEKVDEDKVLGPDTIDAAAAAVFALGASMDDVAKVRHGAIDDEMEHLIKHPGDRGGVTAKRSKKRMEQLRKKHADDQATTGKPGQLWYPGAKVSPGTSAGSMAGGGHKIVLHTTEGPTLDGAVSTLHAVNACPQFAIDPKSGAVVQFMALNEAGRALEHPSGPETNRANAIQIEMVGYSKDTPGWPDSYYANVAKLTRWIAGAWGVPRKAANFGVGVPRMSGAAFYAFAGYCGHEHVPGNSHWDPGDFRIAELV